MNEREKGAFGLGLILGLVVGAGVLVSIFSHGVWRGMAIAGLAFVWVGVAAVLWAEPR